MAAKTFAQKLADLDARKKRLETQEQIRKLRESLKKK